MQIINYNKKYQTMPDMEPYQFEALKADIADRGVLTPLDIDEEGNILDGHHRYRACEELGITDYPTVLRLGLTEEEKNLFSRKSNMMRRHLSRKQIRMLIMAQLKETPKWANNRIAQELGVDSKTVKTMRKRLEATSEIPKFDKLEGADGKVRKSKTRAVMLRNEEIRQEVLKSLKDAGIDLESLGEGFLSENNIIHDSSYNPWAGLNADQIAEWTAFGEFLAKKCGYGEEGAACHVEWLRNKSFETPAEWLGEEGDKWRKIWGMHRMPEKIEKAALEYISQNREAHKRQYLEWKNKH
jgi:hypothetical protein